MRLTEAINVTRTFYLEGVVRKREKQLRYLGYNVSSTYFPDTQLPPGRHPEVEAFSTTW